MAEQPIIVTATDPETGETGRQELAPGQYVVVCAEPMYVAHETVHASGTVQLTWMGAGWLIAWYVGAAVVVAGLIALWVLRG